MKIAIIVVAGLVVLALVFVGGFIAVFRSRLPPGAQRAPGMVPRGLTGAAARAVLHARANRGALQPN